MPQDLEAVWSGEWPGHARIALARQTVNSLAGVAVDVNGAFNVVGVVGIDGWHGPAAVGQTILEPGAGIAVEKQTDTILTAVTVARNGTLHVASVEGIGSWKEPVPVGVPIFDPRSGVGLAKQTATILTAAAIDRNGTLHVASVEGTAQWKQPVPVGAAIFHPRCGVALAKQTDSILVAAGIDRHGTLHIASVEGTGNWSPPAPVGGPVLDPRSSVALAKQTDSTLVAVAIAPDGTLHVAWVQGTDRWHDPVPVGDPLLDPRSGVALVRYRENVLVAAAIDRHGTLHLASVKGAERWQGPEPLGSPVLDPRSGVALGLLTTSTIVCLAVGKSGIAHVAWVDNTADRCGPLPIHGPSRRVCQLTGKKDVEGRPYHINDSESFGIKGTDLGFPVDHQVGRERYVVFLFGDQFDTIDQFNLDPIGKSHATDVGPDGIRLDYVTWPENPHLFRPFQVEGWPRLLEVETPTGGFSTGGRLWAFFNKKVVGTADTQTLLLSTDSPQSDFRLHYGVAYINRDQTAPPAHLADHKLLNLAGARVVTTAEWPGLPARKPEGLIVCGQGYEPHGAYIGYVDLPLDEQSFDDQLAAPQLPVQYFTGYETNGRPAWDANPGAAKRIFDVGPVTFVTLSWAAGIERWLALYTESRHHGPHALGTWNPATDPGEAPWRRPIVLRSAPMPWGPWSDALPLIYPAEAYGKFLKNPERPDRGGPADLGGWLYAPAVIERFTKGDATNRTAVIYYVLSAGDPYHVHLMQTMLRRID